MAPIPPEWHTIYTRVRAPVYKKIIRYAKADGIKPVEFIRNCVNTEIKRRDDAAKRKRDARKRERENGGTSS